MGAKDKNDKTSIYNRWEDSSIRTLTPEEVKEKKQKNSEKKTNNSKEDT
jgi:hypothetical protein